MLVSLPSSYVHILIKARNLTLDRGNPGLQPTTSENQTIETTICRCNDEPIQFLTVLVKNLELRCRHGSAAAYGRNTGVLRP